MRKVCFVGHKRHGIPVPEGIEESNINHAELVVVFGGDGTILRTFGYMQEEGVINTPIFGINKGSVGFMANDVVEYNHDMFERLINHVLSFEGKADIFEKRAVLDIQKTTRHMLALNEVTVHPNKLGKLLEVDMIVQSKVDSSKVSMKGDGVVVATPTGSTAYNLSAGGPILMPHMEAMVVTPLAPFTIAARPIVLGKDDNVTLQMDNARIVVDGNEIGKSNELKITLSKDKMILVRMSGFFDAIQQKLGWNRSIK